MNWADWGIVLILLVSSLISLKRGFIKEALSLVVWLLAIIIGLSFRQQASYLLAEHIATPSVRELAAFALLFVATLLVGACVNFLIGQLVKVTGLTGTDRLLGMLFGLARGFVVVMVILIVLPGILPVEQDPWWQSSVLIPYLSQFEGWTRELGVSVWGFVTGLFSNSQP